MSPADQREVWRHLQARINKSPPDQREGWQQIQARLKCDLRGQWSSPYRAPLNVDRRPNTIVLNSSPNPLSINVATMPQAVKHVGRLRREGWIVFYDKEESHMLYIIISNARGDRYHYGHEPDDDKIICRRFEDAKTLDMWWSCRYPIADYKEWVDDKGIGYAYWLSGNGAYDIVDDRRPETRSRKLKDANTSRGQRGVCNAGAGKGLIPQHPHGLAREPRRTQQPLVSKPAGRPPHGGMVCPGALGLHSGRSPANRNGMAQYPGYKPQPPLVGPPPGKSPNAWKDWSPYFK